ncbi:thymidine kinase [Candidatus Cryosericum septentrionale]|jgi:thymidine kinase|uniref:Thymidine kinase n=1 Tax=Candidatus Cryosericum septentrionale TaxID=2290913 RepID=A0A398DM13_9BACT|nr:thymidine kinase [Candidatus Cryosericum septentrionale]RIE16632.1 thymidine kinase [Candidatus Cryosericum septentrionale]
MDSLSGRIEVVAGCMFSGKSEELIRRLKRAQIARQKVIALKSSLDDRYGLEMITSHSGIRLESAIVASSADVVRIVEERQVEVVGIDEVQFFDPGIVEVAEYLAGKGLRVILAGLDQDFRGEPFGPMPELLSLAEEVTKLTAVCMVCGRPATRTQRIVNGRPARYDDPVVMVGAAESYEARCREHHVVPGRPERVLEKERLI